MTYADMYPQMNMPGQNPGMAPGRGGNFGNNDWSKNMGEFLLGTNAQVQQIPTMGRQGQNALQQLLSQATQGLRNPNEGFEPFANQARQQFQEQTVPSLAQRFTSMGQNKLTSGAFANQLGQAGAGLESQLASAGAQYGRQNRNDLLQMLQLGLTPQFQNIQTPGQAGAIESSIKPLIELLIRAGAAYGTGGGSEILNMLSQYGMNK